MNQRSIPSDDPEVKVDCTVYAFACQVKKSPTSQFLSYSSEFARLKTSVAWILKINEMLLQLVKRRKAIPESTCARKDIPDTDSNKLNASRKMKDRMEDKSLTADDLMKAEMAIIQSYRRERFSDVIAALKAGATVKKRSYIFKLDPVLENGLLRVGG